MRFEHVARATLAPVFGRFEEVTRLRPVALVGTPADRWVAPYAAIEGTGALDLSSGTVSLRFDTERLVVAGGGRTTTHRPRRPVRDARPVERYALTLTGRHLTAFTRHDGEWLARAKVDLGGRVDTHDESFLAALTASGGTAGVFGQLGLRDPRLVTHADGSPYLLHGRLLLTLTSAGPGFFDTAHTSVWSLAPGTLALEHLSDLYFRREAAPRPRRGALAPSSRRPRTQRSGVYGDHATHLVRDGEEWLVATSTWGDFRPRGRGSTVGVVQARTSADLLRGQHVLDAEPLRLPTDGHRSVGVWDPHLVRTEHGWLAGYVSARRFFDFFPVVASGPSLQALTVRAAATRRTATEGTTLLRADGAWWVLASDGRDNPVGMRAQYPVFDLDLRQVGTLDAPYPTNIPWPTLARVDDGWLLVAFNARRQGGRIVGYGSHGDLVIARSADHSPAR